MDRVEFNVKQIKLMSIEVKTVTMDAGSRKVTSILGGGAIRHKLPLGSKIVQIAAWQTYSINGVYKDWLSKHRGSTVRRLVFTEAHGAQVGDWISTYSEGATQERNHLRHNPYNYVSTEHGPWHVILEIISPTELLCGGYYNEDVPLTVAGATAYAYIQKFARVRIGIRLGIVQSGTAALTVSGNTNNPMSQDTGCIFGLSAGANTVQSGSSDCFVGIAPFAYAYWVNGSSNSLSSLTWRGGLANPQCDGWYYTANESAYGGYLAAAYGRNLGGSSSYVTGYASSMGVYCDGGRSQGIVADNASDRKLCWFYESGINTVAPNHAYTSSGSLSYWAAFASASPFRNSSAGDTPPGLTEEEFYEVLAHPGDPLEWRKTYDASGYGPIIKLAESDAEGTTNSIQNGPMPPSPYSYAPGVHEYLEFGWNRSDFECRVYNYGHAVIA